MLAGVAQLMVGVALFTVSEPLPVAEPLYAAFVYTAVRACGEFAAVGWVIVNVAWPLASSVAAVGAATVALVALSDTLPVAGPKPGRVTVTVTVASSPYVTVGAVTEMSGRRTVTVAKLPAFVPPFARYVKLSTPGKYVPGV